MATARAYNKFALHLTKGEIAWQGASLRVALLKNTYSPDVNTHDIWGDISTHEASGTGYVAGGATVTPSTPTQETLSLGVITKLPCSNASWAGLTTTYRYVVIYLYNATAGLRYLVSYYDEGEDKTLAGQPLTVDFGDGVAILAGATTQHNSLLGIDGSGTYHLTAAGAGAAEDAAGISGILKGDGAGNVTAASAGTDYEVAGTTQAHIDDTTDAHDASAISVLDTAGYFTGTDTEAVLAELGLNSRGVVVADVTLDGAWKDGATVDAGANTITVASAAGLANGTPIEFRANTGALPAGITDYLNGAKGIGDGDYFNIINLSGNTFQVTATLGGSTPVDITSAGTAGWQWRVAGANTMTVSGLDLDAHLDYDIHYFIAQGKLTTGSSPIFLRLNGNATNFRYFMPGTNQWGTNLAYCSGLVQQKYSVTAGIIRLRKVADGLYTLQAIAGTMDAPDRTTGTTRALHTPVIYAQSDTRNVTSITFAPSGSAYGLIRNSSRVVVIRRGA